jgi:hypothetical protein
MKGTGTQRQKIFDLLKSRAGTWVPCFELAGLALQYGARLSELREGGAVIVNRTEWKDGKRHSWFKLIEPEPLPKATGSSEAPLLFARMPERHVDNG